MHKIKFWLIWLLLPSVSFGQQVTNGAGTQKNVAGIQLDWSLGEICMASTKTDFIWNTEGVLQPQVGTTSLPSGLSNLPLFLGYGLDNSGTSFTNTANNLMLEFTVGEIASKTLNNSGYMVTQGLLQPYVSSNNSPLPVIGLEFFAKRINKQQVQLNWKTLQEINNKGFHIERKKESENNFTALRFVNSKGQNGNSSFPLPYQQLDTNSFSGKTYYRLKQEDFDGKFVYSVVKFVNGEADKIVVLKAWPIPAPKEFSVMLEGVERDMLLIYDQKGRLVRTENINASQPVKITNLLPGTYYIALKGSPDIVQKMIVL